MSLARGRFRPPCSCVAMAAIRVSSAVRAWCTRAISACARRRSACVVVSCRVAAAMMCACCCSQVRRRWAVSCAAGPAAVPSTRARHCCSWTQTRLSVASCAVASCCRAARRCSRSGVRPRPASGAGLLLADQRSTPPETRPLGVHARRQPGGDRAPETLQEVFAHGRTKTEERGRALGGQIRL